MNIGPDIFYINHAIGNPQKRASRIFIAIWGTSLKIGLSLSLTSTIVGFAMKVGENDDLDAISKKYLDNSHRLKDFDYFSDDCWKFFGMLLLSLDRL